MRRLHLNTMQYSMGSQLNNMHKLCQGIGEKYDIIFNTHKSKLMGFKKDTEGIYIDNNYIKCLLPEENVSGTCKIYPIILIIPFYP